MKIKNSLSSIVLVVCFQVFGAPAGPQATPESSCDKEIKHVSYWYDARSSSFTSMNDNCYLYPNAIVFSDLDPIKGNSLRTACDAEDPCKALEIYDWYWSKINPPRCGRDFGPNQARRDWLMEQCKAKR